MYILTNQQMRDADAYTINKLGVPSLQLMERAGIALADKAEEMMPNGKILCVCGGGNNGGDGFVCARILKERGRDIAVVLCGEKLSTDCCINQEKWLNIDGSCYADFSKIQLKEFSLIVDCLFGTGFHGKLQDEYAYIVQQINQAKNEGVKILSADIPSGVNGENGCVEGVAVQADATLCIGEIKTGVLLANGIDYAGKISKTDIGIQLLPNTTYAHITDKKTVRALLPKRKRYSHKGSFGKAAIVAGSMQYTGAAYLSTSACLRAGAGYTFLFTPQEILPYYILKMPEAVLKPICDGDKLTFDAEKFTQLLAFDSIAYGMGMGESEEVAKGARYLLENYTGKLILDADGLNSLAKYAKTDFDEIFANKKCDVVLTPHVKEFSRLNGETTQEIIQKGISAPCDFAKKYNVSVLLKNAVSIIANQEKISINWAGTSGQAKGGSGDVLSGVIAGLCACGLTAYDSACVAAYLTGRAAEIATEKIGEYSLTASDIIEHIGSAFLEI